MRQKVVPVCLAILIFLLVVTVWIGLGFLPATNRVPLFDFTKNGKIDQSLPGVFGDSFGWVNSLFSALAFAGVLLMLWMQRYELQLQREEMKRVAKVQEESERREALATYMNALESLRQLSVWRMTADPARTKSASFPVVHGLVIQARVTQSLHTLVKDLEPDVWKLYPSLKPITEEGSWVWRLEELLSVYLSLREVLESYAGRSDDPARFSEACNIVCVQFERLKAVKTSCGPQRHTAIDAILQTAPDTKWLTGDILSQTIEAKEARRVHFGNLAKTEEQLLHLIMSMCYE